MAGPEFQPERSVPAAMRGCWRIGAAHARNCCWCEAPRVTRWRLSWVGKPTRTRSTDWRRLGRPAQSRCCHGSNKRMRKCAVGNPTKHRKTRARSLLVKQGLTACVRLCLAVPLPSSKRHRQRHTERHTDRQTDTHTNTHTNTHTDRETERQRESHRERETRACPCLVCAVSSLSVSRVS